MQQQLTKCETVKFLPYCILQITSPCSFYLFIGWKNWLKCSQVKRTADVKVDPETVLHKVGYGGFQEWFELEEASVD
jgi:hypothetical protein